MKVSSKLVKMDFAMGTIERNGPFLIVNSNDEKSTVPVRIRVEPDDIVDAFKAGLAWPVLAYVLTLPFTYRRLKREITQKSSKGSSSP